MQCDMLHYKNMYLDYGDGDVPISCNLASRPGRGLSSWEEENSFTNKSYKMQIIQI